MFWLRESCSKSEICYKEEKSLKNSGTHRYWCLYLLVTLFIMHVKIQLQRKNVILTYWWHWDAFSLEIQEKRNGQKKKLLTKTWKCYKTSEFLWKNDLARIYFDMKQSLRVILSKVWTSERYLETSQASQMKSISENNQWFSAFKDTHKEKAT